MRIKATSIFLAMLLPLLGLLATLGTGANAEPTATSPGVSFAAQLLAQWIRQSRDEAISSGVEPIPADIREALSGHVPAPILDKVRWRAGSENIGSLAAGALGLHPTPAITLDYVVVFRDAGPARSDPALWAHELKHVMQYQDWGVDSFALKYVTDYEAVEFEASEFRWSWLEEQRQQQEGR